MAKTVPACLTALGGRALPPRIQINGHTYSRRRTFKNDFFAVTGLYEGETGKVILKIHRQAGFLLIPLGWMGRLLRERECASFERLKDVNGVPKLLGRWDPTGLVREYIEGHPLKRGERVPDDFHDRLQSLIDTLHQRDMAYVDLEKSENVLVGDDGRPYLFDFQISWHLPRRWGGELWPARKLRRWLQAADRYHLVKLQRRTRPDQLTREELAESYRKPRYLRAYRFLTWPLTWCRRRILDRLDPRRADGERGRVVEDSPIGIP